MQSKAIFNCRKFLILFIQKLFCEVFFPIRAKCTVKIISMSPTFDIDMPSGLKMLVS